MQVSEVLEAVRDRLGDTDNTGWTTPRLVRLINAAQKDICKLTNIYKSVAYINLVNGFTVYPLPDDCFEVTRLEYDGVQLPIYSREDVDNSLVVADLYAVKSNSNRKSIEILPAFSDLEVFNGYVSGSVLPVEDLDVSPDIGEVSTSSGIACVGTLGVVSAIYDDVESNEVTEYGCITGSNLFNRVYSTEGSNEGVIANLDVSYSLEDHGFLNSMNYMQVNGTYGICVGFVFDPTYITVYYNAIPPKIVNATGSMLLDDLWFDAVVYYTVGHARQDDNDEGNYKLGEMELGKYQIEIAKARKASARSFNTQQSVVNHVIYRRF